MKKNEYLEALLMMQWIETVDERVKVLTSPTHKQIASHLKNSRIKSLCIISINDGIADTDFLSAIHDELYISHHLVMSGDVATLRAHNGKMSDDTYNIIICDGAITLIDKE